ncbi:MAG: transposase [Rhodobacteraceae bacterium]|nr:transposase [Paracoccaceae bacterium]
MPRKPYQRYSKEFKLEALRLVDSAERPVSHIARELGLRVNQIYKWKKQLESGGKEDAFPGRGVRREPMRRTPGYAGSLLRLKRMSIS